MATIENIQVPTIGLPFPISVVGTVTNAATKTGATVGDAIEENEGGVWWQRIPVLKELGEFMGRIKQVAILVVMVLVILLGIFAIAKLGKGE